MIGGAGADPMTGGSDSDLFRYVAGSDAVTGEIVNGQGGTDALQLVNTGAIDFSGVSISDVEQLRFLFRQLVGELQRRPARWLGYHQRYRRHRH